MTCLSSSPICEYTRDMGATPSSRGNLDNLQWYKVLHFNLDNGDGDQHHGITVQVDASTCARW
ncbi:hypothetical protein BMONG18_1718, partial [Bifidobacterium mongoliense]